MQCHCLVHTNRKCFKKNHELNGCGTLFTREYSSYILHVEYT